MEELRVIEIKKEVLYRNNAEAEALRAEMRARHTFLLNIMSSPGSGKTTALIRTIAELGGEYRAGVLEADIESEVDARKIAALGVKTVQLHTGGMCHLDAAMTKEGLSGLNWPDLDIVFLENIGNLVCPAEFDTGAAKSVMLLSVPEGDDKPLKYPLMFSEVDAVLISKIDCLSMFDFDAGALRERVKKLNPAAAVFELSAKTGEGFEAWMRWLRAELRRWNGEAAR
ncbi:MAG: hydrogenase nickel incorporation protein HypB [Gracilibacteraceae bacterium]|jgi:hydrogenase nickel incorporation protein HypB|nr:hydrogenase nickel incorporation protein HypB [Gracilibacteraceae bacterium]